MNLKELIKEVERLKKTKNFSCWTALQGIRQTVEALQSRVCFVHNTGSEDWQKLKELLEIK